MRRSVCGALDLMDVEVRTGFVGGTGAGLFLGFDLASQQQGALGQSGAYQLVDQHAEQNHIANQCAVSQSSGSRVMPRCVVIMGAHLTLLQLL